VTVISPSRSGQGIAQGGDYPSKPVCAVRSVRYTEWINLAAARYEDSEHTAVVMGLDATQQIAEIRAGGEKRSGTDRNSSK